jgi:hypothetical protein|tara:strand:- start:53 stop:817 length:765 start_codon:yes stop_codon:yes gene_type:complete
VKKLLITFAFILGATSAFSVELPKLSMPSVTLGVAGNVGTLSGTGKERLQQSTGTLSGDVKTKSRDMFFASGEIFAEVYLNPAIRIGVSYVPYDIESDTTESVHGSFDTCPDNTDNSTCDQSNNASSSSNGQGTGEGNVTQKVQIDITDMTTGYIAFHLPSGVFAKAGIMQADIITNELLGTGSSYGNAQLNGYLVGIGYEHAIADQGVFIRGEINQSEFEDIGLTSTGSDNRNTIEVNSLSGTMARISVGKNF